MNYNARNLSGASKQWTTEEAMAYIKASQQQRASSSTGTDYFAKRAAPVIDAELPVDLIDETGATPLRNKNNIKNLKAVAPVAHPTTASSGDDDITSEIKLLAPSADEPTDKAVVVPLRLPNDEQEIKNTCGAHDDPDPTPAMMTDSGIELVDPDFYKIRIDLFDNGNIAKRNRYTAKLSIQLHQDHDIADNQQAFANFYSRARDLKKSITNKGFWDSWYEMIYEEYETLRGMELDFSIKPHIAILKEKAIVAGKPKYDPVLHTACILYQEQGKTPVLLIAYGVWVHELPLDASFQARKANAPYKMGYYVDPARAELDAVRETPAMKVKTKADFGR